MIFKATPADADLVGDHYSVGMQSLSSYVLEYLSLREGTQSKIYVAKGLPGGLSNWQKVKFASRGVYSLSPSVGLLNFKFVFDWFMTLLSL